MSSNHECLHIGGAEINVRDTGSGPALVFLHYWGGSSRTWQPVADRLSGSFRCVAIDFRGWGQSDRRSGNYRLATLADDVIGVVRSLALPGFIIVGHSMGGKVAQLVAARRPEGLRQLVLVAPAPPTPLQVPEEQRRAMLASYQTPEGVAQAIGVLTERPLTDAYRRLVVEDTLGGAPEAKRAWTATGMTEDISREAAKIAVPIHVIVGSEEQVEHEDALRAAFAGILPDADFTILPGVGHLSPLEATEELAGAIRSAVEDA